MGERLSFSLRSPRREAITSDARTTQSVLDCASHLALFLVNQIEPDSSGFVPVHFPKPHRLALGAFYSETSSVKAAAGLAFLPNLISGIKSNVAATIIAAPSQLIAANDQCATS